MFCLPCGPFNRFIYRTYDEKGKCTPIGGAHRSASLRTHNLQKPARLYWDITPKLAEIIENAVKFAQKVWLEFIIIQCLKCQCMIKENIYMYIPTTEETSHKTLAPLWNFHTHFYSLREKEPIL